MLSLLDIFIPRMFHLVLDLLKALTIFIPKCAEIIRMDEDRAVVISALEAYSELLGELKGSVLKGDGHQDAIINCINDIMTQKVSYFTFFFMAPLTSSYNMETVVLFQKIISN